MRRPRFGGLRARLLLTIVMGSLLAVGALILAFNVILDAQLRGEVDNLLRDAAAAQLRTIAVLEGRLEVPEAPDRGVPDTQTWVFAASTALERPTGAPPENQRAALALAGGTHTFFSVQSTRTRLYAVPILQGSRRLGTLVVSTSLRPYESSAHTALLGSLILGALTVLGIAAISAWAIGRALAPVARMTAAAADWGEHDLSQRFLAGEPHDELSKLAATFDRLLDRLAQSLEREQRFTAEISHELRTPLAKIVAAAELAGVGEPTPEQYRRALTSIRSAAGNLGSALDALLASARAQSGARHSPTEARTAAEQAVRHGSDLAAARGVTLQLGNSPSGLSVAAESDLIERALIPLVENAIRFARKRVNISISTANSSQVIFAVHDDGPGVDPAIRDRIFEPGVSHGGDGTDSGAGLGLPLARRLAHAAGGEIEYVAEGDGATFVLRLPER
jgi:signal transduction histidine kinase